MEDITALTLTQMEEEEVDNGKEKPVPYVAIIVLVMVSGIYEHRRKVILVLPKCYNFRKEGSKFLRFCERRRERTGTSRIDWIGNDGVIQLLRILKKQKCVEIFNR